MPFEIVKSVKVMAAVAAIAGFATASPVSAQSALGGLAGTWSGGGQIKLDNGSTERLTCRAYYKPRDAGLGLALRCASASYRIELRSALGVKGNRLSGTWEERSFNAGGSISGSSSAGALHLSFSGTMSGSLSVRYGGSSQHVSITSGGGGLSSVSLTLNRV
jgi:hypothetical protein